MSKKEWSKNAKTWMISLGQFKPTTENYYIEGCAYDFEEGGTHRICWDARSLREIAAACLEVAEGLEGGGDG